MRTAIVAVVIVLLLIGAFLYYRSNPGGASPVSHEPVGTPSVNARAGPEYAYPNLDLTPGAIDPTVTQDNIQSTICVPGYTKTVRPPERITHRLKLQIMAAYGRSGDLRDYELDHFIPLELGGCPDCVTNLWPEPYDLSPGVAWSHPTFLNPGGAAWNHLGLHELFKRGPVLRGFKSPGETKATSI